MEQVIHNITAGLNIFFKHASIFYKDFKTVDIKKNVYKVKYSKNFFLSSLFLVLILQLNFFGCASEPSTPIIDYSSMSGILYKIEQTEKLLKKGKILEALVEAKVLVTNTCGIEEAEACYKKCLKEALNDFDNCIKAMQWNKALIYYRSIKALDEKITAWDEAQIKAEQKKAWQDSGDDVLVSLEKTYLPPKGAGYDSSSSMDRMLKGSVTVWVDRGVKIEKGIGFADRVIGSGFFIDKRGYFITNYHVIQSEVDPAYEGYSRLYIKSPFNENLRIPAKVVGWDPAFDLALVKTEITPEFVFKLGSSKTLNIGSKIYAIGSPAGLEKTLTAGIVSAKNRRLLSLADVLQIDAPINHGNSGGPVIDEMGTVQAIVFAGLSQNEGLNFAIPVELLKAILPALFVGGHVKHGWLGLYGNSSSLNSSAEEGVNAAYVMPGGAACRSRLPEGAIITKINGHKVKSPEEIQNLLLEIDSGTIVKLTGFLQNEKDKPTDWYVLLENRPEMPGGKIYAIDTVMRKMLPYYGFYLDSTGRRRTFRVSDIINGSFADEAGFAVNDLIEIHSMNINKEQTAASTCIYVKKVKAGYIESFMMLSAYMDSPQYF